MTVFANGLEVACKAQGNKVIAAFPDVCFTPPQTPATPPGVPVPYPSFGFDSDTDKGTGTVKIGGQTITQKNKSYLTRTTGTEAGCAPKKGIVTSKNTGKEYAVAWSSDVKADGEPVSRMSDFSTNNHASPNANTLTFPKIGKVGVFYSTTKCLIGEYKAIAETCNEAGGEAHHIVPDKVYRGGTRATAGDVATRVAGAPTLGGGMCICLSPDDHKEIHASERDNLVALGKPGMDGLSRSQQAAERARLQATGEYGTAPMGKIHDAAAKTVDDLAINANCKKKAKEAIKKQSKSVKRKSIGRTSNRPPNKKARVRMGLKY
jgi:hypothetical protein